MNMKEESEKVGLKLNIQKTKIMASGSIPSWQIDGKIMETVTDFIYGAPKSLQIVTAAMKLKDTFSLEEKLYQSRQHIKKQRHYFANKCPSSQGRSNQSILKVINPEYSLEGLMLKLKLHYFGQLMGQADSVEKTDAGKDLVRRGQQG